jgi:hypothetical protein
MGNLVFQATLGGQVNLVGPNTASTFNINVPAVAGTLVTTGDTGTVTNTMLAGSIANAKLLNSSVTVGSTAISLGGTATTVVGLTSLATNTLTSAASTALTLQSAGTTAVTIDTSQNVGIGVTPSTGTGWANNLEMLSTSNIINQGTDFSVGTNWYYNSGYKYKTTAAVTNIYQKSGTIQFQYAASGTAGSALTFLESMRIDNSGNVGIGTSSPQTIFNGFSTSARGVAIENAFPTLALSDTANSSYRAYVAADSGNAYFWNVASGANIFATSDTERMRIDSSGQLLVGASSQTQNGKIFSSFNQGSNQGITLQNTSTGNSGTFVFMLNSTGGTSGSISQSSASTVLYNATSDYRLKSNVTPVTTGLSVINQLNPVNFTWIPDNKDDTGFLAHEFQAIIPRYVVGVKDAVDSEGNPIYQQMDNSGAIPYLVSAIKELKAINDTQAETINALTARVVALEAK